MNKDNEIYGGIYIHIPFCVKKCLYCDFYSTTDLTRTSPFLAALEREMQLVSPSPLTFDTLYIGGGTPSVLEPGAIEQIIAAAYRHFAIRSDAELTVEVNPGSVTLEELDRYRLAGVNRLNIGVQSFNNNNLKFLGRIHSRKEALASIDWAHQAGFENIGLDLIYGLPGRKPNHWLSDLDQAFRINPEHLSCYILTSESGTPLDHQVQSGRISMPSGDRLKELFEMTVEFLSTHGYRHYEVSNFVRLSKNDEGHWESRHNSKYWSLAPYIGLGPSAHSFSDWQRSWNHRSVAKYIDSLQGDRLPVADSEVLTTEQMVMEAIYLGFRTANGIDLMDFKDRFGMDFLSTYRGIITDFQAQGFLSVSQTRCALTTKGMVLLDSITEMFTSLEVPDVKGQMSDYRLQMSEDRGRW